MTACTEAMGLGRMGWDFEIGRKGNDQYDVSGYVRRIGGKRSDGFLYWRPFMEVCLMILHALLDLEVYGA